jgi:hypothetical protein
LLVLGFRIVPGGHFFLPEDFGDLRFNFCSNSILFPIRPSTKTQLLVLGFRIVPGGHFFLLRDFGDLRFNFCSNSILFPNRPSTKTQLLVLGFRIVPGGHFVIFIIKMENRNLRLRKLHPQK